MDRAERAADRADARARDSDRISRWTVSVTLGIAALLVGGMLTLAYQVANVGAGMDALRTEVTALRTEVTALRTEVAEVRTEVAEVRTEVAEVRTEAAEVRTEVAALRDDLAQRDSP